MSAIAVGLRWFGGLLVSAAEGMERPALDRSQLPEDPPVEVEEELRRMRERVQGRYY